MFLLELLNHLFVDSLILLLTVEGIWIFVQDIVLGLLVLFCNEKVILFGGFSCI